MKLSNLSLKKIQREILRFFKPKIASTLQFQPEPVPMISWTGQTRSPLTLTPRHRELLNQYPDAARQVGILLEATEYIDFRNKTILEVGGSNLPRDLIFNVLGAKKWICVNLLDEDQKGNWRSIESDKIFPLNHQDSKKIIRDNDYVVFDGSVAEIGKELHDEFHACVSLDAFEHIQKLAEGVDCIYRCLRGGGVCFIQDSVLFGLGVLDITFGSMMNSILQKVINAISLLSYICSIPHRRLTNYLHLITQQNKKC